MWTSTAAFTFCFAVWTVFSAVGISTKDELGPSEAQFGLLIGTPIVACSLSRLPLGIRAGRLGGRKVFAGVMVVAALACLLGSFADSCGELLIAALGIAVAGGAFPTGMAYLCDLCSREQSGPALGTFGARNAGAGLAMLLARTTCALVRALRSAAARISTGPIRSEAGVAA